MTALNQTSDPLAFSRARDAQLAELKAQAVACGTQDPAAGAHRYAVPREEAEAWADFWITLGAHVLPLRMDGSKRPLNNGWPDARAMTRDDIVAWLMGGGGIGVNLGKTGWAVLDADNARATELFRGVGFTRTVVTANAQVPDHPKGKTGGGQFVFRSPEGFDPDALHSRGFELPDGAKGDLLGGRRFIVAAPTRLDEAGGLGYLADPEGIWGTGDPMPRIGQWIADRDADCDYGALEPLRGLLGPKQPHERECDSDGEWRTVRQRQIDELISWEQVFDCAEGAKFVVETIDSCGCGVYTYSGQTSDGRGLTAHDGCSWGWFGRTWSGSAQAHFGLPESTDRLRIAALLRGFEPGGAEEVALGRAWGIEFGGLTVFADTLDETAERYEDFADDPERCAGTVVEPDPEVEPEIVSLDPRVSRVNAWRKVPADRGYWIRQATQCRSVARQLRSGEPAASQANGETYLNGPVIGAVPAQPIQQLAEAAPPAPVTADPSEPIDAETVEVPGNAEPGVLAPDDAITGEIVEEWERGDQDMWRELAAIEAKLRGERDPVTKYWKGMTPALGRIANLAESRGIFFLGLVESILPRVSARVPAYVLIESRAGGTCDRSEGLGMGYNSLILGPPASGKSTTQRAAETAIPLPVGIAQVASGTAEGMTKEARDTITSGGAPTSRILHTSVYAEADEFGGVKKELSRDGNAFAAFVNGAFFGGSVQGQTTSDSKRKVVIPPHSTRFASQIGAQPQLIGLLLAESGSGLTARYAFAFAGSEYTDDLGPLYGKAVPSVLQAPMPWDPEEGVPFGFRRAVPNQPTVLIPAGDGAPEISSLEDALFEPVPPESIAPVWITVPLTDEERRAARDESARRSRNTRQALTEDRETGRTAGHDGVRIQKAAVLLALLDGLTTPERVHLEAAQLLAEATALACAEAKVQSDSEDEAEARKRGRNRGIEAATGKATANQVEKDAVAEAADALFAKLTRPVVGVKVRGQLAKGFGGEAKLTQLTQKNSVGVRHRGYIDVGMQRLIDDRRVTVTVDGTVRVAGALTAAPNISGIGS